MKAQVLTSDALDQKELPKVLTAAKRADFSVCLVVDGVCLGVKIAGKQSAGWCKLDVLQHDSATWKPSPAEAAHSVAATRS
jgi:hypothetical protein